MALPLETVVLAADAAGVRRATDNLRAGGLVAFPTETVYGLGAHALDAAAVRGIFQAKGRPANDPVIVHLARSDELERVAHASPSALLLAQHFWPGPLTLVLPRQETVPLEVTAGLESVAVRVPAHPVAHALLTAARLPIAAPSANLFSRPSPTRAEHVLHDLGGRIHAVLDGGPTSLGLESTIVDLASGAPRLLRPGGLAAERIEEVLGTKLIAVATHGEGPQPAPGLLPTHYAPRAPLVLIAGPPERAAARLEQALSDALEAGQRVGAIVLAEDSGRVPADVSVRVTGSWREPETSAQNLFAALRDLDRAGLDVIFVRDLAEPSHGLGRALADRLRRAASSVIQT
jgi:L-threonylcarbamoyladenylate synthase